MHIRTDDEVYRVDAVWLGPPRATFPWRARYSAYGVGLLVMLVVMFVQRRLGIDLGFFSVAWALLITVGITRFVSRRINDERPLLEWLTLFVHELRGPRARTRVTGGALTTGHVTVHRDRPKLTGAPTAVALPRGSDPAAATDGPRVRRAAAPSAGDVWGPPPRDDEVVEPRASAATTPDPSEASEASENTESGAPATAPSGAPDEPAPRAGAHLTPGVEDTPASHRRRTRGTTTARPSGDAPARRRRSTPRTSTSTSGRTATTAGDGFGPPSAAEVGDPVEPTDGTAAPDAPRPELPPVPDPRSAEADIAAWTGAGTRREPVSARRAQRPRAAGSASDADPDRTQRRPVRPRRRAGWPMSNEPATPEAPFGPGTRARRYGPSSPQGGRGGDGAAPE
ncbi:hypothetical protein [Actinomycetospora sp. NBRC 106375]|uniref:hypothetical protein n=1 Tax=Actinomycetospora sp. NBRC 106375 TaxID=3032207 RepID=UPI0025577489|nr:hypothetical protein [Actinomycetospora sp. NBRC 106375]